MRELLRQRAAPGQAEHVDGPGVAELLQETVGDRGQRGEAVRPQRRRRAADAGHVERHDLHTVHRADEGGQQLEVGPHTVEDQ